MMIPDRDARTLALAGSAGDVCADRATHGQAHAGIRDDRVAVVVRVTCVWINGRRHHWRIDTRGDSKRWFIGTHKFMVRAEAYAEVKRSGAILVIFSRHVISSEG